VQSNEQLKLLLKPFPTSFSDLDQQYIQALSIYPSTVNIKIVQVVGTIKEFDDAMGFD